MNKWQHSWEETIKTYWTANVDTSEPPLVWDAFKAVARGEGISAIKTARVNDNEELNSLKQRERRLCRGSCGVPYGGLIQGSSRSKEKPNLAHQRADKLRDN